MSDLSVMILCGQSPRHLYVANRLCRAARPVAIVHEANRFTAAKLRWLTRPKLMLQKVWRWLRDRHRYAGNPEGRFFFGPKTPALERADLIHIVPHINDRTLVELADRLQPDVIAVFGTSLISSELLQKGRLGIINLHGGLSPEYRGADCTFWALYNGEPAKVGCTIHFIDSGIDTGKLIAHISPEVHPGDVELLLFWRAVKESAAVYSELFQRLQSGEKLGMPQTDKGRLYQVKDRGWRHERQLSRAIAAGLLNNVDLPARVKWFVSP